MGIAHELKSIKGAFHYILHRIPSLADYIISTDTISDETITVSVYEESKRRSARLQQSTTVLQTVDDKDTSPQGVKNAKLKPSDNPPNVDHDEDIPSDLQEFVADMDQNITTHLASFKEYSNLLDQSKTLIQEMREDHDTLKAQISSLKESFTTIKKDFTDLKVEHEILISRTTQEHTAFKRTVTGCIAEMNNERVKCEQQLRAVVDNTVLEMSNWSTDFSRTCQSTLE